MHDPENLLLVGTVGRPHGVRGDVKVAPETDDPRRFDALRRVFIGASPETARELAVSDVRYQYPKGRVVVLLGLGLAGREGAEALRGQRVYALGTDLPPLAEGETFLHDLVGFAVEEVDADGTPTGRTLGTVRDLYEAAQLLFAIAPADGGPDVLLPDVPDFVRATDVPGRRLLVAPPEGLFDLDAAPSERDVPDEPAEPTA